MAKLLAIVKRPNEAPEVKEVEDSLKTWQEIVGGYVEVVPLTKDASILVIVNEEGKLRQLEANLTYGSDILVGTIAFVGNDAPEFRSLKQSEREYVLNVISKGGI